MPAWIFADRFRDPSVILAWAAAHIPAEHVVRVQTIPLHLYMSREPVATDLRFVIDHPESAKKLAAYLDSEEARSQIIADKRFFRVSWRPLRPETLPE